MKEKKGSNKAIVVEKRFKSENSIVFEKLLAEWLEGIYNSDKDLSLTETEVAE